MTPTVGRREEEGGKEGEERVERRRLFPDPTPPTHTTILGPRQEVH